jgi:hypothetical protein
MEDQYKEFQEAGFVRRKDMSLKIQESLETFRKRL